jgi:hypothetical protein
LRVFQNSGVYPSYRKRFDKLASKAYSFQDRKVVFLDDRFGACHFLLPVLNNEETAFFTNGDDEVLQKYWAKENGLTGKCTLENILLAQIEHHKSEVFYNLDQLRQEEHCMACCAFAGSRLWSIRRCGVQFPKYS